MSSYRKPLAGDAGRGCIGMSKPAEGIRETARIVALPYQYSRTPQPSYIAIRKATIAPISASL